MLRRTSLLAACLATTFAVACAEPTAGPNGYPLVPTGADSSGAGGDNDLPTGDAAGPSGDPAGPDLFVPPAGAYVLVSPVAASAADESDRLVTSAAFAAEVRVGHVSSVRAVGFRLHWDPAVLALTSHAPAPAWLSSNGGAPLIGLDRLEATAGSLAVALAAGGIDAAVATATSEAVLHLELAWVGAPTATAVHLDLAPSYAGILDDAGNTPLTGVTTIDLTVTPAP